MQKFFSKYFIIVVLFTTIQTHIYGMNQHALEYYETAQVMLNQMDKCAMSNAKKMRHEIIDRLKTLTLEDLKKLYKSLSPQVYAAKYGCILLAGYKHHTNLNPKIDANLFFRNIRTLVNFSDNDPQDVAHCAFYSPLFDAEHIYHVLPLLEAVLEEKINKLNFAKSNIKAFPITMLQLQSLDFIVCRDSTHGKIVDMIEHKTPQTWSIKLYQIPGSRQSKL